MQVWSYVLELCGVVGGAKVVGSGLGLEVELVLVVLVVVVPLVVVVVEVVGGGWVLGTCVALGEVLCTGVALGEVVGTGVGEVVLCLLGVILGEVVCGTG